MTVGKYHDLRIYLLTMHCHKLGITDIPNIKTEARKMYAFLSEGSLNKFAKEVKARLDKDLRLETKASSLIAEWKSASDLMPK